MNRTKTELRRFSKMNSAALLKKIMKGGMSMWQAKIIATVVERRFPTPIA